jgi:hypothetical protein
MRFTTKRRAASILAGSALVAGLGITAVASPASAGAAPGQITPFSVCGWRPANNANYRSITLGQAWIRRGGDTSCGALIGAGTGDHVTVHCAWRNNVTGAWWDYLHDDERLTTGWMPDSDIAGASPVTSTRC